MTPTGLCSEESAYRDFLPHASGRQGHHVMDNAWFVAAIRCDLALIVMLELGFNRTEFGKAILAACFINDLGTVIALGLIFAPFTARTAIFVVVGVATFAVLPYVTPRFFAKYGGRVSELEAKYILFTL